MKYREAINSEKSERLPNWQWEEIRQRILERDHNTCVTPNCGAEGSDIDHIIPKALGGTDDDDNLQTLCSNCHKLKTRQDHEKIRRANKARYYEKRIRRTDLSDKLD